MKLISHTRQTMAESASRLAFGSTGSSSWPVWDRFLLLDDAPLMHIGNICETCEFFFRHVGRKDVSSMSIASVKAQLDSGVQSLDDGALPMGGVVPAGSYTVALFEVNPLLVRAGGPNDYFTQEQRLVWPVDPLDEGMAEAQYYRCGQRALPGETMLFEFVIPLQDPRTLDPARVDHYRRLIQAGERPTAVAIGVLDTKASTEYPCDSSGNEVVPKYPRHWCLANYLIDGHHKLAAAEAEGTPITLLSFISDEASSLAVRDLVGAYLEDEP